MRDSTDKPTDHREGTVLLSAAAVVLITIGLATAAWWIAGHDVSDYPAWIEASATLAAVGAAIVAGLYAARAYGLEQSRDRRWAEAQRSSQASLVAAWPATTSWGISGDRKVFEGAAANFFNGSQLPVTDVKISWWLIHRDDEGNYRGATSAGLIEVNLIPPMEEAVSLSFAAEPPEEGYQLAGVPRDQDPELIMESMFTDSAGELWYRNKLGHLVSQDTWWELPEEHRPLSFTSWHRHD